MILGDRCTRACGFCLVDTRKPLAGRRSTSPRRVADAVRALGLAHVVITCVARDDLADGGASGFAATIDAVRAASPGTTVELLISDCKGDDASLAAIFAARPDVLNHNLETVARLQRAARPSAGYARSLAVLGRAKDAGLVTKSGLILGMGETDRRGARRARRPASGRRRHRHAGPVPAAHRRSTCRSPAGGRPPSSTRSGSMREAIGFAHVESGPLVRSSYHAREGIDRLATTAG